MPQSFSPLCGHRTWRGLCIRYSSFLISLEWAESYSVSYIEHVQSLLKLQVLKLYGTISWCLCLNFRPWACCSNVVQMLLISCASPPQALFSSVTLEPRACCWTSLPRPGKFPTALPCRFLSDHCFRVGHLKSSVSWSLHEWLNIYRDMAPSRHPFSVTTTRKSLWVKGAKKLLQLVTFGIGDLLSLLPFRAWTLVAVPFNGYSSLLEVHSFLLQIMFIYRSVLKVINAVFEKNICRHVRGFLGKYTIVCHDQRGFRPNNSTFSAVLILTQLLNIRLSTTIKVPRSYFFNIKMPLMKLIALFYRRNI